MKIILFLLLSALLLRVETKAQSPTSIPLEDTKGYPILDTAQYSIRYGLSYKRKPKAKSTKYQELELQIGRRYNRFYYAPKMTEADKDAATMDAVPLKAGDGVATTVVLLDKRERQRIVTIRPQVGKTFIYTETEEYPEWEMLSGEQNILNHHCKQARASYRGRTYTAWYTPEVPMPVGPWKLGGLPGLILKAEDDKGEYVFECIEIKKAMTEPILGVNPRAIPMEFRQIELYIKNLHKHFGKIATSEGAHITLINKDGSRSDGSHISFVYNPIELE